MVSLEGDTQEDILEDTTDKGSREKAEPLTHSALVGVKECDFNFDPIPNSGFNIWHANQYL